MSKFSLRQRKFRLHRRNGDKRRAVDTPGGHFNGNQHTEPRAPEDPEARRHTRRELERMRQASDSQLALRVQDSFVARGLTHSGFSMAGGYSLHVPEVISVAAGPPTRLDIRPLPGQQPDDFIAQAPAIAEDLGVAEVRVITLGPSLIRLELLGSK
jgi:hypothetical protein